MTRTIITDLADVQAGDLVTAAHRVGAVEHEFSGAVWSAREYGQGGASS